MSSIYDNVRYRLPGSTDEISLKSVRWGPMSSYFALMRGAEVVGWEDDLLSALDTADDLVRGKKFNFELYPLPEPHEEEPSQCA